MKGNFVFGLLMILVLTMGAVSAAPVAAAPGYSTMDVSSPSCRVIMPWAEGGSPAPNRQYPIIAWANGWDNTGNDTVAGYTGGLSAWALDGPYIIIADKSRSPKVSTLTACLNWMVAQNTTSGSIFNGKLNTSKIGLAGHSQGGGVAIMAGNAAFNIVGVVSFNPYQPNWKNAEKQKGPVLIFAGDADTTTPVAQYTQPAYDKVKTSGDQHGTFLFLGILPIGLIGIERYNSDDIECGIACHNRHASALTVTRQTDLAGIEFAVEDTARSCILRQIGRAHV